MLSYAQVFCCQVSTEFYTIVSREEAIDSGSMSKQALALQSKKDELQRRERERAHWASETASEKAKKEKKSRDQRTKGGLTTEKI